MALATVMEDVPDGKPHIFIKLGSQRKLGQKSFNYNGPPISYPLKAVFEVCENEGDKKGTVKYQVPKIKKKVSSKFGVYRLLVFSEFQLVTTFSFFLGITGQSNMFRSIYFHGRN